MSSHLLPNALHDLAVRLHHSHQGSVGAGGSLIRERVLELFDESLRVRGASIRQQQQASIISEEETRRRYVDVMRELKVLREIREEPGEEQENYYKQQLELDLFPLILPPSSLNRGGRLQGIVNSEFKAPPVPRLVELEEEEAKYYQHDDSNAELSPSHSSESTRSLINMALCQLSKASPTNDQVAADASFYRASQYLAMASELLPSEADADQQYPRSSQEMLLAADAVHAEAVLALRRGHCDQAEERALHALCLYSDIAFGDADADSGSGSGSTTVLLRQEHNGSNKINEKTQRARKACHYYAEEGTADSLSLLLRIYHLTGRPSDALAHFDELLRLRTRLYGSDSIEVAASLHNLGTVLLVVTAASVGQHDQNMPIASSTFEEVRKCIEVLVNHPSLAPPPQQSQREGNNDIRSAEHHLYRAGAIRALEIVAHLENNTDLNNNSVQLVVFHQVFEEESSPHHDDNNDEHCEEEDFELILGISKFHVHAAAA